MIQMQVFFFPVAALWRPGTPEKYYNNTVKNSDFSFQLKLFVYVLIETAACYLFVHASILYGCKGVCLETASCHH